MSIEDTVKLLEKENTKLKAEVDFHKGSVKDLRSYKTITNIVLGSAGGGWLAMSFFEWYEPGMTPPDYVAFGIIGSIGGAVAGYFMGRHLDNREYTMLETSTNSS